ncbi:hypothetical protein [Corynebacterium sp. MNWGS58]
MDFNALLEPIINFFKSDQGLMSSQIFHSIFQLLYPANSEAAHK